MTKKDRIALVISTLYFLIPLGELVDKGDPLLALIFIVPLIAYWGYRFIRGDISFLGSDERDRTLGLN